ncbi:Murein DD-endopeptidase MepM and murein hydrolase activator NlpD, contain LysM domain [Paenibacillus sp. yr247]|uniref:M23 family metallopeptidase n=1 Tax=Paenibacillus sp. yr247 TaxID=1761880 RepID=UPI00088F647A|nr:M23 family metallopeptidase [Paenibacillus sp. yr247]SDO03486.1 Murein DD-endopeptidase MepM and murein hydrolase activator NlpD, contain LysM domain [Paenibacillus sp. yr247]
MKSKKRRQWPLLAGACLLAACAVIVIGKSSFSASSLLSHKADITAAVATPMPTPQPREAVEFRMLDFDRGWVKYADGIVRTEDGGAQWHDAVRTDFTTEEAASTLPTDGTIAELLSIEAGSPSQQDIPKPLTVALGASTFPVKQSQFLTPRIGWALLASSKDSKNPLLITADGGQTWVDGMTEELKAAILKEKKHLQQLKKESALYATKDAAKAIMGSKWKLVPESAAPGDVVLVRHDEPGSITWLNKTYSLQPYGAGYFTYLPITMNAKPGKYPIGDQTLTIRPKKFETQYLNVTAQMESMKQDTGRIAADQKKIDLARSQSEPEFLFSGPFVQPVEGILTTPYGYTRYVNGKYDSSHLAIDLAAKEGTPIKATNDGVVALADSLYLTGNSIYIDHGMGLFSQYAHLSELRVKPGERVKQGDIIGLVGTTGFSTGPHLHFTFWAHNVQVNPDLFFNTTPFRWVQPKG